jgi:hypothetical protein
MAKIITQDSITVFAGGKAHIIRKENRRFSEVCNAITRGDSEDRLAELIDVATTITNSFGDSVSVISGKVYFKGEEIHNVVVDRILSFIDKGLPHEPLVKFLERLLQNPSHHSVRQLYGFLEKENLPITDEGYFLAYKAVTYQYLDKHTRTVDNTPGANAVPPMPRYKVDDNPDSHCSTGYHVGALPYVQGFASGYGSVTGDKIVVCQVDPANVVSVPNDCNGEKMRVTHYLVLCDYNGPLPSDYQSDEGLFKTTSEHHFYRRVEWRDEVNNGDTELGYEDWVQFKLETEDSDDDDSCDDDDVCSHCGCDRG